MLITKTSRAIIRVVFGDAALYNNMENRLWISIVRIPVLVILLIFYGIPLFLLFWLIDSLPFSDSTIWWITVCVVGVLFTTVATIAIKHAKK